MTGETPGQRSPTSARRELLDNRNGTHERPPACFKVWDSTPAGTALSLSQLGVSAEDSGRLPDVIGQPVARAAAHARARNNSSVRQSDPLRSRPGCIPLRLNRHGPAVLQVRKSYPPSPRVAWQLAVYTLHSAVSVRRTVLRS